jgi:hypothetical protein
MVLTNWCYAMCDSLVLPFVSIVTFLWTVIQEIRHQKEKEEKNDFDSIF